MKNKSNKRLLTVIAILTGLLLTTNLFPQEDWGQDPLYSATIKADIDGVRQALADGADINRQTENGYTSLMWACTYSSRPKYAEVAKFLISEGADVIIAANDGTTAILEAAGNSEEVTRLLMKEGADINAHRDDGRGIFTSCIFGILMQKTDLAMAELILSKGGDVNEAATSGDVEGWAPIHYAVSNGIENLVQFLVKNGANVNAKTKNGLTPLSL
ncbi:MAG: ankyrin repeat domain-containing protein, partial [Bacteroidales bacterium]|nr:ankyrin repeat domain-containing protein [Bacteroidales bacterium]